MQARTRLQQAREAAMKRKQTKVKGRGKFSDATRAKIYAWDRAVCALTGANLWMLDYGLSGMEQEDWADHIKPAARGGNHVAENGVCTSADANFTKNANGRANEYWFIGGRPTWRFFADLGQVPAATAQWLRRDLQPRDWYFNRSLRNFTYAVAGHSGDYSEYKRHADRVYYPKAALRFLIAYREKWQSDHGRDVGPTRAEAVLDWQARGLLPDPVWPEQMAILDLLHCERVEDIDLLAKRLSNRYARNFGWVEKMDRWTNSCDPAKGQLILEQMKKDADVSPFVEDLVTHNITALSALPKPVRDEADRETTRRWTDYE
jgi:hypothetical protein